MAQHALTPNPSIERTCSGKPGHAAHVERPGLTNVSPAISSIVDSWHSEIADHLRPGLAKETVAAIFQSVGRTPSADVMYLYSLCGGMRSVNVEDKRFFAFWPLESAAKATEAVPLPYFVFGDGFVSSHRYSFRFENAEVSSVYGDYSNGEFTKLAESVDEFFLFLRQDPQRLWLP